MGDIFRLGYFGGYFFFGGGEGGKNLTIFMGFGSAK